MKTKRRVTGSSTVELFLSVLVILVARTAAAQTKELGPRDYPLQSCSSAPATGFVRQCADTVTGNLICVNATGGSCSAGGGGGAWLTGTTAMPTGAVGANNCTDPPVTASVAGALTTDPVAWSFGSDVNASAGWDGAGLHPRIYVTAGTINFRVCNTTTVAISTVGAMSINWAIPNRSVGPTPASYITGSGLTVGSLYYQAAAGLALAQANGATTLPAICLAVTTTQCLISGTYQFGASQGWTVGTVLYVSNTAGGAILTTAPSTSGAFVQRVGVALAVGTILFQPSIDVGGIQ